jgi:membrane associated rhomboid family serine protease
MADAAPDGLPDDVEAWHCYRHPEREVGVRCRRCERPICPDCMIAAPVGFQCPECVRQAPPVRTLRSLRRDPVVTIALVAMNAVVFVATSGRPSALDDLGLNGPAVASGEWWRVITSGFVHVNLLHVGFNCLLLYQLGGLLEPVLGRLRFALLYATALVGGSLGVLLLQPHDLSVGASGAVFGLLGAGVVGLRSRGIDPMQSGLGGLLVINLVLTFARPGISIGAHVGGLVTGAAAGWLLHELDADRSARALGGAIVGAAGLALLAACLVVAAHPV